MDVFYAYTYGSSAWYGTQALPLLMAPKLIVAFLADESHSATSLEIYFARGLAMTLLTLAVQLVVLTGSIPLTNDEAGTTSAAQDSNKAPYAVSSILISTVFQALSAFYTYASYVNSGQFGFAIATLASSVLGSMGIWCLMFGTEKGRTSKRTGADKRTSGWPFKNVEADKKKRRS